MKRQASRIKMTYPKQPKRLFRLAAAFLIKLGSELRGFLIEDVSVNGPATQEFQRFSVQPSNLQQLHVHKTKRPIPSNENRQ